MNLRTVSSRNEAEHLNSTGFLIIILSKMKMSLYYISITCVSVSSLTIFVLYTSGTSFAYIGLNRFGSLKVF